MVISVPCKELNIKTGMLLFSRMRLTVSSPFIPGISTSSVMASGLYMSIFCKAVSPLTAVATTSNPSILFICADKILRINAESSTTNMRIGIPFTSFINRYIHDWLFEPESSVSLNQISSNAPHDRPYVRQE